MKQNRTFSLSFFGIIKCNVSKASLGRIENDVGIWVQNGYFLHDVKKLQLMLLFSQSYTYLICTFYAGILIQC